MPTSDQAPPHTHTHTLKFLFNQPSGATPGRAKPNL